MVWQWWLVWMSVLLVGCVERNPTVKDPTTAPFCPKGQYVCCQIEGCGAYMCVPHGETCEIEVYYTSKWRC